MKGTHWIGLALTLPWACNTKDGGERNWDTGTAAVADESNSNGGESDGSNTDDADTSGDETGGVGTGGNENGGNETGGDETAGAEDGSEDAGGEDAGGDETGSEDLVIPPGLNGTVISPPLPPTSFSALNLDGTRRNMDDLMDGPTVMWFYPLAGSPG